MRYRQAPQTACSGGCLRPGSKAFSPVQARCAPRAGGATSGAERLAHHERTAEATGHGAPWAQCVGQPHCAGRRGGAPHGADGPEGLAGGLGPA